jgi:hypothetical protein
MVTFLGRGAVQMATIRYRGFTIATEHPCVWIAQGEQVVRDLIDIFTHPRISTDCLRHLIANRHRLISGHYELPDGRGCMMFLLTEPLGPAQIRTRDDLTRFFGRESGRPGRAGYIAAKDSPEYQPAKWLVRLIDRQICDQARQRYGRSCELFDYDLVIEVAQQVLTQRQALEPLDTSNLMAVAT